MLYQSMKLTNGIWCLAELKMQPGNNSVTVSNYWRRAYRDLSSLMIRRYYYQLYYY